MKSFQQWQAANVADVDRAARCDRFDRLFEDLREVIKRREILDHRVDDYRVIKSTLDAAEIVSSLPSQCHVLAVTLVDMLLYEVECHLREVNTTVMLLSL